MKHTIRWILISVVAGAIGALFTYPIAHYRGYESGYRSGVRGGLRNGVFGESLGFFEALRRLRAGDLPRATRFMETCCFTAAQSFYKDPTPRPGEAGAWGRAQGLDRWPDTNAARALAKGLSVYRDTYRTNSADWDGEERKLEAQLAKVKSDDYKAWARIVVKPTDSALNPQGGASGGEPIGSETNQTPATAAPRRSP